MNLLPLPIAPADLLAKIIVPALKLLPAPMTSDRAKVPMIATSGQESAFKHRWQVVDANKPQKRGPARGLWQFELGTKASRGGVWGVYLHPASRYWLAELCKVRGVEFTPRAIWLALETDDILAAGLARLLMFTDAKPLPQMGDEQETWKMYRFRCWRPGKPHPETWSGYYRTAMRTVLGAGA